MLHGAERFGRYSIVTVLLLAVAPIHGHHSDAGLDRNSVVAFEGTVTEFVWRNPHVYVLVENVNPVGEAVEWELQMGPTTSFRAAGGGVTRCSRGTVSACARMRR